MFREAFIYNIAETLPADTGTTFLESRLAMNNFDFDFKRTIHNATSNLIYAKFFDNDNGRYLYKTYDDLRSISGVSLSGITTLGFVPFNWPVSYLAKANSIISAYFSDFANNGNNVLRLAYHGDKVTTEAPLDMHGNPVDYNLERNGKIRVTPIIYESPAITCNGAAGTQKQEFLTTDNDSDFVCTKITGTVTGDCNVIIQDMTRDTYWQNVKTYVGNLIGNGQFPNVLTSPRFVKQNSKLLITMEDQTAAPNTLRLYFHGYKRY